MLFKALDLITLKISPELVGETIFIDNIIRDGINFNIFNWRFRYI